MITRPQMPVPALHQEQLALLPLGRGGHCFQHRQTLPTEEVAQAGKLAAILLKISK